MDDKDFIPGIYNYCDRWCERCDLTNRCRLFYDEQKQLQDSEGKDNFTEIISKNLEKSVELLHKMAEEKGIDLDNIIVDKEVFQQKQQKYKSARKHPLVMLAKTYTGDIDQWLKDRDYLEPENSKHLKNIDLGINLDESDKALRTMDEAMNIINLYKFQIQIKLTSAINFYPHNPDFEDEIQNMHHTSARIALIGVNNSMKAWQSLLQHLDDDDGKIVDALLQLHQLQTKINQQFPLLHKFKRPGFED